MKKLIISILSIILIVFMMIFVGSGFVKNTSAYIDEFEVKENEMTIHVGVSSSVGYVRTCSMHQEDSTIYLDFYNAFGGINGNIGAKSIFTIPLTDDITDIAVNRADGYQTYFHKDEYNTWN